MQVDQQLYLQLVVVNIDWIRILVPETFGKTRANL